MAEAEPRIRIENREELIYLLAEAAAIEHNVMCSYLYAAWSLKRGTRDGLTEDEAAAVRRWKDAIFTVAIEEMTHLTLAGNLACSIGAAPHLSHPSFPIPPGYHASGLVIELAPFSRQVLEHFIFIERPEGKELSDASEFVHPADYHRTLPRGRLMPSAQDYLTVGHLYRGIRHGFERLSHYLGEKNLFCGSPAAQIGPQDAALPGLMVVTDLKSAEAAIETIIEQGEGAPAHSEDSHYQRFLNVRTDYEKLSAANPNFEPAFPVAHNPVLRRPLDASNRVFIHEPQTARVLDLANATYVHMLRCLVQAWGRHEDGQAQKKMLVETARDLMGVLDKVAQYLASMPAGKDHPGVNAGMTFTMLRDLQRVTTGAAEMRMMGERVSELAEHAGSIFGEGHELSGLKDRLAKMAPRFEALADPRSGAAPGSATVATVVKPEPVQDAPLKHNNVQVAEGKELSVSFEGKRCIHARFCVLGAPGVFKANTPGQWIFPDEMESHELVHIVKNCPSGALTYAPKVAGIPAEAPPQVNTLHLRENGPYAVHAPMKLDGAEIGFRATLCRCGMSKRKPFCDGSHKTVNFMASGEPETRSTTPLEIRDGMLSVEPEVNGPLVLRGNLEICAGTGRTIDRVTSVRLCRCGNSRNKPFCDNTHKKVGWVSD